MRCMVYISRKYDDAVFSFAFEDRIDALKFVETMVIASQDIDDIAVAISWEED